MIRRISKKRSERGEKYHLKRSSIRKKPRKPSEFKRIYGSKQRVEWVKSLPCSACGVIGYSENAHVLGNGGTGRKGDYTGIAPLCGPHPSVHCPGLVEGCHQWYDEKQSAFYNLFYDFTPANAAAETQAAWLAFSGSPQND